MSHFTVLVIGPNPEDQLAPYHEFECTGVDNEYIQDVDITDEVQQQIDSYKKSDEDADKVNPLQAALEYHGLEKRVIADKSEFCSETHKYGYAVVRDGALVKAIRRTNPNAKWDWYLLGGRWTGFFKLKQDEVGMAGEPGIMTEPAKKGHADQVLLQNIDIEGMHNAKGIEAAKAWDEVQTIIEGTPECLSWDEIRKQNDGMPIQGIRDLYWAQPRMQAWQKAKRHFDDLEDYLVPRAEYIDRARKRAIMTFAVVKDGQWYERGSMGWWGMVSDEKDADEWLNQFNALIDGLPGDTLMSVYDCHI